MRAGIRRLLLLNLRSPQKLVRPLLTNEAKLLLEVGPYPSAAEWIDDCLVSAVGQIVKDGGGPAWDGLAFDGLLQQARSEIADTATRVASGSLSLFETLRSVYLRLDRLAGRFPAAEEDIELQLDRLIYPGLLSGVGAARVPDVQRYIEAIDRRLEMLPGNPSRDAGFMARLHVLEDEHDRLLESMPLSPGLIDIIWMLEELRVSFFAQALGTGRKVSEKRIRQALNDVVMAH
jgi:ATP-dependent helicase HrpA